MLPRSLNKDIGELLIDGGFITKRQLQKSKEKMAQSNESLQKILVQMGFVSEKDITEVIGQQMGVDFVDLESMELEPEMALKKSKDR